MFNLESNEMYSYFLVFYFFTNVTVYYSHFVKFGKKEQTLLHLYKQLFG